MARYCLLSHQTLCLWGFRSTFGLCQGILKGQGLRYGYSWTPRGIRSWPIISKHEVTFKTASRNTRQSPQSKKLLKKETKNTKLKKKHIHQWYLNTKMQYSYLFYYYLYSFPTILLFIIYYRHFANLWRVAKFIRIKEK